MPSYRIWAAVLTALFACASTRAADGNAPKIDKAKLEAFVRYTEGYTPLVKIEIGDPGPSEHPGFLRLPVSLSMGQQKIQKVYFVTPDGNRIVNGSLWDLNQSPYLDTLRHLPKDGPAYGPTDAKVTIVVFSDFQCPYCRSFAKTIRDDLPKKYPNVRVVFKDFPIPSIHKWAVAAAEASHCIGDGNPAAFWAFHDWIFEHQGEVNEANLKEKSVAFAQTQKLDGAKVGACIDSHAKAQGVEDSTHAGEALGIQQTPTFFINGRLVSGALPWTNLQGVIELELNRPASIPGPSSAYIPSTDQAATAPKTVPPR